MAARASRGTLMRAISAVTLLSIVAVFATAACRSDPAPPAPANPTVLVVRPQRGAATRTITLPGDLVGYYQTTLYSKVTGYLQQISVDKGDWVHKGQVLASIEVPELNDKLQRERAQLAIRKLTYERLKGVADTDKRLVAQQQVDVARSQYEEAEASVKELATMVGYTQIVAPFGGVITARFVDPGALIRASGGGPQQQPGQGDKGSATPVLSMAMIDELRVYVYVPEEDVGMIRRGTPATLTLKEYPGRIFKGDLTRFATSLDLSTRTMLTEIDVKNPDHQLYPGMYANVTLELERHADALKLPPSAVSGQGAHGHVFVVRQNRLEKVPVSIGIRTGSYVEIKSGLNESDQVVSHFTPALYGGEAVRVENVGTTPKQVESASR
jgi:membrane fusion protein (multidrug efflux system)